VHLLAAAAATQVCAVSQLVEYGRQHVADRRRHVRRLMSLPGCGSLRLDRPEEGAVNVLAMMFAGFSACPRRLGAVVYKMGFGATSIGAG